jgi:hypothetical protein
MKSSFYERGSLEKPNLQLSKWESNISLEQYGALDFEAVILSHSGEELVLEIM